jgi:hypothetical protein
MGCVQTGMMREDGGESGRTVGGEGGYVVFCCCCGCN